MPDEDEKPISATADLNSFRRLLASANAVHHETVKFPFHDEEITVHYQTLRSGEAPPPNLPDNVDDMTPADRVKILWQNQADVVFAMIDKANKSGKVPPHAQLDRETWDALGRDMPLVRDTIMMRITGLQKDIVKRFFGGPPRAGSGS